MKNQDLIFKIFLKFLESETFWLKLNSDDAEYLPDYDH